MPLFPQPTPSPTPHRHPPRLEPLAWPLLCTALGLAGLLAWAAGAQEAWHWQSASWMRRPWTLWSAALVHLSGAHLFANLAALLTLAVLGSFLRVGRSSVWAVLVAWPGGTLALAWWPQVTDYCGMSGLLCALLAVLWAHATVRSGQKALSYVLFGMLALKLLSEHAWSAPIAFDPSWGFNVVYAAHLAGAVAGAVLGLIFEGAALLRRPTP